MLRRLEFADMEAELKMTRLARERLSGIDTVAYSVDYFVELLKQNGFARPPGWSSDEELYKVIDGVSYSVNSSEPFPCEPGHLQLCFHVREFKPPEQKKAGGLFGGLFK